MMAVACTHQTVLNSSLSLTYQILTLVLLMKMKETETPLAQGRRTRWPSLQESYRLLQGKVYGAWIIDNLHREVETMSCALFWCTCTRKVNSPHLLFLSSTKNRQAVLQSLLTLCREYPDKCNWEEYFKPVLLRLLDLMGDTDVIVKCFSLKILREILKTEHDRLKDYAELTTLKVLKCFTDSDSTVRERESSCECRLKFVSIIRPDRSQVGSFRNLMFIFVSG